MDDKKDLSKDAGAISKVVKSGKPGKPKNLPKSGGRTAGTPNKKTLSFANELDSLGFSIPEKIIELYELAPDVTTKIEVVKLAAKYRLPIPTTPIDDSIDVTPDTETSLISIISNK